VTRTGDLIIRVIRATLPFGKKAELARFLQVPAPRITEWIAGKYEPGAEVTLSMLEWVQAEEGKQQRALAVHQHDQSRKTQVSKARYAKQTQARKKR
jgi:hypothetical protein